MGVHSAEYVMLGLLGGAPRCGAGDLQVGREGGVRVGMLLWVLLTCSSRVVRVGSGLGRVSARRQRAAAFWPYGAWPPAVLA